MSQAFNIVNSFTKTVADLVMAQSPRVALTNTLPTVAQTAFAPGSSHPPPASANGYTANGYVVTSGVTATVTTNDATLSGAKVTVTASGGDLGPFQYVLIYLDGLAGDPLWGWWDLGAPITLSDGQSRVFRFSGTDGVGIILNVAA